MSYVEREEFKQNTPKKALERDIADGKATKLKKNDKLNYVLSGRIRER